MSSGTVVLAPGAVIHVAVAPVTGTAVDDVAATVLISRAAVAGASAPAGPARLPGADVVIEAEACWEAAARAAVRANSDLRVVRAAVRRTDTVGDSGCPPVPSPVPIGGRSLDEVLADTERVDARLGTVRVFLAERSRQAAARIAESVRLRPGSTGRASPAAAEIEHLLTMVDADAGAGELADVYAAAEEARRAPAFWLPQLTAAVEQLRTNTARARRHAAEAAQYLEGIAAIDVDPTGPYVSSVVAGLNDVVARERDLSESLRDDARLLIADGERAAANRLLADRLRARFRADGFDVRNVGDAGSREVFELTRPGRPGHCARVSVGRGEIRHRTVVDRGVDHRADVEWCTTVDRSIAAYCDQLTESGIGVHVVDSRPVVEVQS